MKNLNDLKIDEKAKVIKMDANSNIKQRLLDIGLINGIIIYPTLKNKGMTAYNIKGSIIAIRNNDTKSIKVEVLK